MKKSTMIMGLLALCLLALAVTASAQADLTQKCQPIKKYDACWSFMKKKYQGPAPSYSSDCCKVLRDDSPNCICKAITGKGSDVDLGKALEIPKACGKKTAVYYCAPKKSPPPPKKYPPPPNKYPPPYQNPSPSNKYPPPPNKYPPPYQNPSPSNKYPPPPNKYPPPYQNPSPSNKYPPPPPKQNPSPSYKSPPPPIKYPPPPPYR